MGLTYLIKQLIVINYNNLCVFKKLIKDLIIFSVSTKPENS